MKTLSVLIPSRAGPRQHEFLMRATQSVLFACQGEPWDPEIIIGLDPDVTAHSDFGNFVWAEADKPSQAAALNACAAKATGEYLAVLEDDDWWHPCRLAAAKSFLSEFDFLSSTQLEVTDFDGSAAPKTVRINDFATPSGWLMTRRCWEIVGPFNEDYRYRLDNEWLGRLGNSGLKRAHLVECTAPADLATCMDVRPWLANVIKYGRKGFEHVAPVLRRHTEAYPLVTRLVHPESGMGQLERDPQKASVAQREEMQLRYRFGYIPW